jgi:hypothetical protein
MYVLFAVVLWRYVARWEPLDTPRRTSVHRVECKKCACVKLRSGDTGSCLTNSYQAFHLCEWSQMVPDLLRLRYLSCKGKFQELRSSVQPCQLLLHAGSWQLLRYFRKSSLCGSTLQRHIHYEVRDYMNHILYCLIVCFLVIPHVSTSKLI